MTPETFWARLDKSGECWLWTGATAGVGYGHLRVGREHRYAHRFAWEDTHGSIPNGMDVLHRCDTPLCVRPEHLFLGTARDNTQDMIAKGRHPRICGAAPKEFAEALFAETGALSGVELARELGISQEYLYCVRAGRRPVSMNLARRAAVIWPKLTAHMRDLMPNGDAA